MITPHLHTVTIIVNNLSKTLAFYRTLGFNIPNEVENDPHVECVNSTGITLCFVPLSIAHIDTSTGKTSRPSNTTLQFKYANAKQVGQVYTQLIIDGYTGTNEPHDTDGGERLAEVKDPDGNNIVLFARL